MSTISAGTTSTNALVNTGDTTGNLVFQTNGTTTAMTIDTSQNVGIGTSSPVSKLDVKKTSNDTISRTNSVGAFGDWDSLGAGLLMQQALSSPYGFALQAANAANSVQFPLLLNPSGGNVGIGTTSPNILSLNRALTLNSTGNQQGIEFAVSGAVKGLIQSNGDTEFIVSAFAAIPLTFRTGNTERMRIDSSGNLLVGTTAPLNGSRFYTIATGSAIAGGFKNDAAGYQTIQVWNAAAAGTRNLIQFSAGTGGTSVGTVSTDGTNTTYGTSSDYRLKENIQPMTGALEKVAQLKPCTYTWKGTGAPGQGFIAHELQAVVPDAVVGEKDAVNEDGSIRPQNIDTSFLVATLTAAIQELKTQNDDLRARVAALEGAQ